MATMKDEEKVRLKYLDANQKLYLQLLLRFFEQNEYDIVRTVLYLSRHPNKVLQNEYRAMHALTAQQKNQVICEILLPF